MGARNSTFLKPDLSEPTDTRLHQLCVRAKIARRNTLQAKCEQQEYHSDLANAAQSSALGNQAEAGRSDDYAGKNVTDDTGHADP